jgi:hypothetical protein
MIQISISPRAIAMLACTCVPVGCLDESEPIVAEHSAAVEMTKPVKVCGRRRSQNSPEGWWVDSGIYVKQGASITVDGRNPGGGIQPWPGGEFWSPEGTTMFPDWRDTLAYRSALTDPAENVTFALMAKIGRDGTALKIGSMLTFNAPASGTLYLGFNDGVNFEDNSGSWNISVTFESAIRLGAAYGSELIHADRVNTALVDRWGIVLTVHDGNPDLTWTPTFVDNVVRALSAVEPRLGVPLSQIFGGVEMRLTDSSGAGQTHRSADTASFVEFGKAMRGSLERPDNRSWGRRSPPPALDYYPSGAAYSFATANDRGIQNTIIHELGHLLEYRTIDATTGRAQMADIGLAFDLRPMRVGRTQDVPADIGTFWEAQVLVGSMGEIVADSFLNWVRDSYVGMINRIDAPPARLRRNQQRAAWYWNGGTVGATTSPGWGGTNGFRSTVSNFVTANSIPAFLRAAGGGNPAAKTGGDIDPMCTF